MLSFISQIRLRTLFWIVLGLPFLAAWIGNLTLASQTFDSFLDIPRADPKRKQLLRVLERISTLSPMEKQKTLLFIPQTNNVYWQWYENCKATPFIAPAITGVAMLDGLPPAGCRVRNYGYTAYQLRSPNQSILQASDTARICQAAEERGFTKVIVLDTNQNQQIKVRHLDCE